MQLQLLLIKIYQLVNRLVPHEGLAHEQHQVWPIHRDQLGQRAHQWFIVLHCVEMYFI